MRKDPCHARKFAARLQAASTHTVLLRVEAAAGHGQGKPATKQIEERADVLAFLARSLGFADPDVIDGGAPPDG